jgi:hypothetical protein
MPGSLPPRLSVVYDAGVLVAAERGDRAVWSEHRVRLRDEDF